MCFKAEDDLDEFAVMCKFATVHHSARGKFAIRRGDWILIDAPRGDDNGVHGEPQWFKDERGYTEHVHPGELFNLREDSSQRDNRYSEKPELVLELKSLLKKYQQEGRSIPGAPQKNDIEIQPSSPPRIPERNSTGNNSPQ